MISVNEKKNVGAAVDFDELFLYIYYTFSRASINRADCLLEKTRNNLSPKIFVKYNLYNLYHKIIIYNNLNIPLLYISERHNVSIKIIKSTQRIVAHI